MNKVTLSFAALAAIGSSVQVQAADLTQAELTAKQNAIKELRIQVNAASNYIEKNCPDVKNQYLLQLSEITNELNTLYSNSEPFGADSYNSYEARIESAQADAVTAQKPYTVSVDLKKLYATLKTQYDNALAEAANYPYVKDTKTDMLKNLGVEALGEKIAAYDLTKQDIVVDQVDIVGQIDRLEKSIDGVMKTIAADNDAVGNNKVAYDNVNAAYKEAKEAYDKQLQDAIKSLPSPVYENWQNAAVAELNEQYRIINAAKNDNEAAYNDKKAGEHYDNNINAIRVAQVNISTIVANYVAMMNAQEAAYAEMTKAVADFQAELDRIKADLAAHKITSCDTKIKTAQASINKLKSNAESMYNANEAVSFLNNSMRGPDGLYKSLYGAVRTSIKNIGDGKHTHTELIKNAEAYEAMVADMDALKQKVAAAKTEAEKASEDGKYNAAQYFTNTLANINKSVNTLEANVKSNNTAVTAVSFQNTFNSTKANIENQQNNDYVAKTAASLAAYNTAAATAKAGQENHDALAEVVTDKTVTTDGSLDGTTYDAVLGNIQKDVNTINTAIANAEKKTDAAHMTAMQEAAKLTVNDGDVQTLINDYTKNKDAYDLASAEKAAQAHINSANDLISDMQQTIDGITVDADKLGAEFAPDVATEKNNLQTELNTIKADFDNAKTDYEISMI